jgi:hypothetical protein
MLGELQRFAGRPADGRRGAEAGLALAEEIDSGYARYLATGVLGRIALALGDPDEAERRFTAAVALAEHQTVGDRPGAERTLPVLERALAAGGRTELADRLRRALDRDAEGFDDAVALAVR